MTTTSDIIQRAAEWLLDSARARQRRNLPDELQPKTEAEAVAVCEALWRRSGLDPVAWKLGAADPKARAALGLELPFLGQIPKDEIYDSPARFPFAGMMRPVVESEYAFRIGRDLPPHGRPWTRAEVEDAVAELLIGIEVPESRLGEDHGMGALGTVCDFGGTGRYVCGAAFRDWRGLDMTGQEVVLRINGEVKGRGTGASVMGHPAEALTWLANHLNDKGTGLKAGQLVTTGSCTGILPVAAGDEVVADFGPLGRVEVSFPA